MLPLPRGGSGSAGGRLERRLRLVFESRREPVTITWLEGASARPHPDRLRRALDLTERCRPPGVETNHVLRTSGHLLDDDRCAFLGANNVLVGLLWDGPDRDRVPAAARLLRRHGADCNLICPVRAHDADRPLELYRYLRDEVGVRCLQFVPVVEQAAGTGPAGAVTGRTVRPRQWGDFLIAVFDEWVRRDVGTQFVRTFEAALASWLQPARRARAPDAGRPGALPVHCRCCSVLFACEAGHPGDRFAVAPDGEPGLNHLCGGYRAFFQHIDQPMRVMAALKRLGHDAGEVMRITARYERDNRAERPPGLSSGTGDPRARSAGRRSMVHPAPLRPS
ncbi:hypothetical protein [Actinomadura sp. NTSP31]|uniref:hypothetical protein n=1 Tax=Actinomadura sp. NTSP31 TaxID=1735447 RepID=UPI0035BEFB35